MMNLFCRLGLHRLKVGENTAKFAKTLAFILLSSISFATFAQDRVQVSGKVTDETGAEIPGVTVMIKGTTTGTVTDINGAYTITPVPANGTLVFSNVGSKTQEIPVDGRLTINLTMGQDDQALQEIVVIGYGTQKVKDATGAVASLGAKDFNKGVINNPEQLLQGRVAGVQTTTASGDPGAGIDLTIRGTTSIRGNNGPLYVVDGVPLDNSSVSPNGTNQGGAGTVSSRNPLNFLNPSDIENISILKDASAAAIYGSRGANGVVLITTKSGKSGAGTFNFNANLSVANAAQRYKLYNATDILPQFAKAGLNTSDPLINGKANTDWQKEVLRTAITQNYQMSFGGGTAKTNYFFSLGYQDQQGIIKNTAQDKFNARVNASHKLFADRVVVGINLTTTKINDQQTATGGDIGYEGNVIGTAITRNPTFPVLNSAGGYFTTGNPSFRNPVSLINNVHINTPTTRTLTNAYASWRIIDNLTYKFSFGLDNSASTQKFSIDPGTPGFVNSIPGNKGLAVLGTRWRNNTTYENTLNYSISNLNNNFDILGGFAYYKYQDEGDYIRAQYFVAPAGFPIINNIGFVDNSGSNKAYDGGSYVNQYDLQSFFGRATYNFKEKYFITATMRADGSSKFGVNNKYGYFPSVSGAWNIANESFIPKNAISILKLRGGWGITGNSEGFPINQTITTYIPNKNSGGIQKENVANPDLKWEETTAWNVGLDFGFMNGRISGTVEYFHKGTDNLLFPLAAAQPDVATTKWTNIPANIVNKGVEFSLNWDVLAPSKPFHWNVGFNSTFLKNKVEALAITTAYTGNLYGQGLSGAFVQPITVGYPLYSFFTPTFLGYDSKGNTILSDKGNTYQGSPFPTMSWGLNNDFSIKNFSFTLFITGQNGGKIFNNTALALFGNPGIKQGNNSDTRWVDAAQAYTDGLTPSSKYVESSNFVRLSNLTIGYNFKFNDSNSAIKGLRLSLDGQNLLLFTKYKGLDPEILNPQAANNGIPSKGIDYVSYPKARIFTFGLNASF